MSGYGKPQFTNGKDFETTRTMEDPLYLSYAQPSLGHTSLQLSHIPYSRGDQLTYGAGALFQGRSPLEEMPSAYTSSRPSQVPEVVHWEPRQGLAGTQVIITLVSAVELDPDWTFTASFGNQSTRCSWDAAEDSDPYYHYTLTTTAPSLSSTSWNTSFVPLNIRAQDEMGNDIGGSRVGDYRYTDTLAHSSRASPDLARKRKLSPGSARTGTAAKRMTSQPAMSGSSDAYEQRAFSYGRIPAYMDPTAANAGASMATGIGSPYSNRQEQALQYHGDSPQHPVSQLSAGPSNPSALTRGPSPQTPSWVTSALPPPSRSPNVSAASSHGGVGGLSPTIANPPLVRTSSLQQSPSPSSTPTRAAATLFNPYAMYPNKAILKLQGDLDGMTKDWSAEEHDAQRRLVQFYRTQTGSTIHANFRSVTPEERQTNIICISCIWCEAKGECYVTSVDTIALLEALVAVKFTTEEKNRIRRNLEGFRPMTVSKGKTDSEEFFKLIMGFPNPKPRNIEKDVKAFPWKTLDQALKKIISKYSASYSSTASAIPPTSTANYRTGYEEETAQEQPHPPVQYAVSSTATNSPYAHGLPYALSGIQPPASSSRMPVPFTTEGSAALRSAHTPEYPLYQYPTSHLGQNTGLMPMAAGHEQSSQHSQHRTSWELEQYLDHPTSTASNQALYAMPAGHEIGQYNIMHASSRA